MLPSQASEWVTDDIGVRNPNNFHRPRPPQAGEHNWADKTPQIRGDMILQ